MGNGLIIGLDAAKSMLADMFETKNILEALSRLVCETQSKETSPPKLIRRVSFRCSSRPRGEVGRVKISSLTGHRGLQYGRSSPK